MNKINQPLGEYLHLHFKVIENGIEGKEQFLSELTITNKSNIILDNNWTIYFNFLRKTLPTFIPQALEIKHINGDFFQLKPTPIFTPLHPNESISIQFLASYWAIKKVDAPSGFYIVYKNEKGKELAPQPLPPISVAPFIDNTQLKRTTEDNYPSPTPASRFQKNKALSLLERNTLIPILPTPFYFKQKTAFFHLTINSTISYPAILNKEVQKLITFCKENYAGNLQLTEGVLAKIRLSITESLLFEEVSNQEAYILRIDSTGIEIIGAGKAGIFYGIQSFLQLLEANNPIVPNKHRSSWKLPFVEIKDKPQFAYRGLHLDVARNFHPVPTIKKLLRVLSFYKLNKFHFHLTDDEGWRIEIPGIPELTEIGGRRGHTLSETDCLFPSYGSGSDPNDPTSSGNGYYEREEFIELIRFAQERHVEIIPAIDFPGHARAAIKAMEVRYERYIQSDTPEKATEYLLTDLEDQSEYESVQFWRHNVVNIGLGSTYQFIEKIVEELIAMYQKAGIKLTTIHIGGDEVPEGAWVHSPACQQLIAKHPKLKTIADLTEYFILRIHDLLTAKGIHTAGWEEIIIAHKNGEVLPNKNLLSRPITAYTWNTIWGSGNEKLPYALANLGFKVVLANAPNLYFDTAYDKDPEEAGYYWAGYTETEDTFRFLPFDFYQSATLDKNGKLIDPAFQYKEASRLTTTGRNNILGIQGQLWGETITSQERLAYLLFPRMFALAERAWAPTPKWSNISQKEEQTIAYLKAWNEFSNRLSQIELPRIAALFKNIQYRIPMPGVQWKESQLEINSPLPSFVIRYTIDGTEPTATSPIYKKPLSIDSPCIKVKLFTHSGSRSSRTSTIKLLSE